MQKIYYSETSQLDDFFNQLKKTYRVFSPVLKQGEGREADYVYRRSCPGEPLLFNPYRSIEPLKSFFSYPGERLAEYFTPHKGVTDVPGPVVVFGVKNCDLAAHRFQDFVFLEGPEVDALYRLRRENTILVCGDCTDFKQVCHCLGWEIMPYPGAGFDLNLSPLNDGYLVETGSAKGEELIRQHPGYFLAAKETQISSRRVKREGLTERLKRHLLPQGLVPTDNVQQLMKQGYGLDTWKEFMLTCVECGGCNFICDTCHCFLLADDRRGSINEKVRVWDSCLYANYARVAGGANSLKLRAQRLRNRFMKKFDFFVDNLGLAACCGCGRCIEVCPGKIDIREVLKDLAKKLGSQERKENLSRQ
jgi:ferredoxin